jgi:glycosyltransferase involved in cell wall biosynthesis
MMRVLHVYSGNLYGGIEAILVTIARRRSPHVQHAFALCFEGRLRDELLASGAHVHPLGAVRMSRPRSVRAARRALESVLQAERFDRVICHAPWSQALFGGIVRRARVPLVFWAHDVMTGRHWTERLAKRVPPDLVVANSKYTEGMVETVYARIPVRVVYAPVEQRGPVGVAERQHVRSSLNTSADAVVVIQASRSEPWKGHVLLIDALAKLSGVPGWVWWQAGGAQRREEREFLGSLRALADRGGIADRVRWLGERTDVPQLLGAADIYCQANTSPEAFGVAFVEALAAGIPVVTTSLGGAREIVDGSCGVLVPPNDPAALADALRPLIDHSSHRRQLAAGAPARARLLCDPAAQIQRLTDVLAECSTVAAGQHGAA